MGYNWLMSLWHKQQRWNKSRNSEYVWLTNKHVYRIISRQYPRTYLNQYGPKQMNNVESGWLSLRYAGTHIRPYPLIGNCVNRCQSCMLPKPHATVSATTYQRLLNRRCFLLIIDAQRLQLSTNGSVTVWAWHHDLRGRLFRKDARNWVVAAPQSSHPERQIRVSSLHLHHHIWIML